MKTMLILLAAKRTTVPTVFGDINMFIVAVVCALAFLLIAMLVASLIKYEAGSNPKDPQKRRLWFWILGILALVLTFVLLFFVIPVPVDAIDWDQILDASARRKYENQMAHYTMMAGIATGVSFVLYVVLGFVLSKIFKSKKIGDWF